AGAVERRTLVNDGPTDVVRIIGVRAYTGQGGAFELDVSVPPYHAAAIAEPCLDVSGATPISGLTVDDAVSAGTALPFAFSYFGTPVTHWRASTNGWIQLS